MARSCQRSGATQFSRFESLPVEIRLQIWRYSECAIAPRFVPVRPDHLNTISCGEISRSKSDDSPGSFTVSAPPVPPILHACRESRYEALRHYQKLYNFGDDIRYVYVLGSRDTLLMLNVPACHTPNSISLGPVAQTHPLPAATSFASSIQTVAIPQYLFSDLQPSRPPQPRAVTTRTTTNPHSLGLHDFLRYIIELLPALRHITIVNLTNERKNNLNVTDWSRRPLSSAGSKPAGGRTRVCCLTEPRVRNRYAERRLQDALSLVTSQLDNVDRPRPSPTWSIKTTATCSSRCPNTVSPTIPAPKKAMHLDDTHGDCYYRKAELDSALARSSGTDYDEDNGEDAQRLPASWQTDSSCLLAVTETGSLRPRTTTMTTRRESQTPSGSLRRCGWSLAEVPDTHGILDFAASRLAFYRRYNYWS